MLSKKTLLLTLLLAIILGIGTVFFWQKNQDLRNQINGLEYENDDLKDQIGDLEVERDDAITEKEQYEELYNQLVETIEETERKNEEYRKSSYNNYSTNNSYTNSYNNNSTSSHSVDIPNKLSKIYFDGGYIIKPSFGNLHNLMNLTMSEFKSKMGEHDYDLSTDGDSYISSGTTNCCYSIDKEWNSVTMIFTKEVNWKSSNGENALKIKNTFIGACEMLDASKFEPLIEEEQYFQDLDKYRFLQSLKDEFDSWKEKGFTKTTMIKGHCEGCHCGDKVYQFYTNKLTPAFAYIIHEEKGEVVDVFMCNLSSGMSTIEMGVLQNFDFWR